MFTRNAAIIGVVLTLVAVSLVPGARAQDLPNNFINAKLIFPINGVEYERVLTNGIGLSVSGSYLPASGTTYKTFGVGLKKYIGNHRMFYVAAYPQVMSLSATVDEYGLIGPYKAKGSISTFMLLGAVGWRGVWSHFTLGGDVGGGLLGLSKFDVTGFDPTLGKNVTTSEDLFGGSAMVPMVQLYLGYAF